MTCLQCGHFGFMAHVSKGGRVETPLYHGDMRLHCLREVA